MNVEISVFIIIMVTQLEIEDRGSRIEESDTWTSLPLPPPVPLLPFHIPRNRNLPHRNHLLVLNPVPRLLILQPQRRLEPGLLPAFLPHGLRPSARPRNLALGTLHDGVNRRAARAGVVVIEQAQGGFAAAAGRVGVVGEAGRDQAGPGGVEEGPHDGEAGADDADVAFDVDPDAGVDDGPCVEGFSGMFGGRC